LNPPPTANADDERPAVLRARIPERLTDEQRRRKYDEPLVSILHEAGLGVFVGGCAQTGDDGDVAWVGFEVRLVEKQNAALIAERLVELGAPLETVIEIETERASLKFTLAEAGGSPGR
jgi:hypothetical protein